MRRTVQLLHELPDGSHHVDWLVEWHPGLHAPLLSWRLPQPLHTLTTSAELTATRIPDHRRRYLWYQGELSENRGRVTRLSRGVVHAFHASHTTLTRLNLTWLRLELDPFAPCRISQTIEFAPTDDPAPEPHTSLWRISVV